MSTHSFSRRHFLGAGAGAAVSVTALGACSQRGGTSLPATTASGAVAGDGTSTSLPAGGAPATTAAGGSVAGARRLVVVQLHGGNDLLNTLPPTDGRYMDQRPTLALPEADRLALAGVSDFGMHPSLAALVPAWENGSLALVRGIGFDDPNRSHFVSMDRWWRADDPTGPGWLGRVLDLWGADQPPLAGTALGGGAPLLAGSAVQPTVVPSPESFRLRLLDPAALAFGDGQPGSLDGAARRAFARALEAMADFSALVTQAPADADLPEFAGGAPISDALATAAALLTADVGARIVVVSADGFDTHSGQAAVHAGLLEDLGNGLAAFQAAVDAAGLADDVLLVTTSEFGRRVAQNGSEGTDHGAGGVSLVLGSSVAGGAFGDVDLGDLLDGDIRPVLDPRALYTPCLDWLGVDAELVLGRRYEGLAVLR